MSKLFKRPASLIMSALLICTLSFGSQAAVLTNIVYEEDGTEVRKIKYTDRADVSRFFGLLAFIRGSFKYDFYDRCQGFFEPIDNHVSYEYLWTMLWSKYMFQKGQSKQELERSKFLAHLILSHCVKDRFMRVYWPTLKSSISGILNAVGKSQQFIIEARKPRGKMWQDWKIITPHEI